MAVRRFPGPQRVIVTAGALYRRVLRRRLIALGLPFQEDRALLDSVFAVDVPKGLIFTLHGSEVA